MPNCYDRDCINGVVVKRKDNEIVQKICERCQKMERDLEDSEDYVVYYENGRAVGYELIT